MREKQINNYDSFGGLLPDDFLDKMYVTPTPKFFHVVSHFVDFLMKEAVKNKENFTATSQHIVNHKVHAISVEFLTLRLFLILVVVTSGGCTR